MPGIVSRILGSFDRIPTPLACGMTMVMGCAEAIALFINNVPASAPWYLRVAPFAAFGVITALGVSFIAISRPVVVHRETGPLAQRALLYLQDAGRIATLHAVMASIVIVPALVVTGRFEATPADAKIVAMPVFTAAPAASTIESASPISPNTTPVPPSAPAMVPSMAPSAPAPQPSGSTGPTPAGARNPPSWAVPDAIP